MLSNGPTKVRMFGGKEHSHSRASCCQRRKRHNATQTSSRHRCCCAAAAGCHCHVTTTHHHHCHHHCHHHHYGSGKHLRRHHHPPRPDLQVEHPKHSPSPQAKLHSKRSPLPASRKIQHNHNKSSPDSSEDPQQGQLHSAAIAIEIDAATVTENNSSTATSNFPYKVASEGGGAPMNLLPLSEQHRQRRRGSLNSNTTIETDELSRDDDNDDDDDDDDDVRIGVQPEDEEHLTPSTAIQPSSSSSSTARAFAGAAPPRNECVRIKRKRFMPDAMQDYCSSCSRCSSCSCDQARTSSCSSLDEDPDAHELTVAAQCHRCVAEQQPISRRSSLKSFCSCHTNSCCCGRCSDGEGNGDDEHFAGDEGDGDDDDDETTGQRESFCTAVDHTIMSTPTQDEAHSSTLTPLSTQEHTMRSDLADPELDGITDADASSLSQSAEYFSLSSAVPADATPTAEGKEESPHCSSSGSGSSSNKHWSKHIRLKRSSSPFDSHL